MQRDDHVVPVTVQIQLAFHSDRRAFVALADTQRRIHRWKTANRKHHIAGIAEIHVQRNQRICPSKPDHSSTRRHFGSTQRDVGELWREVWELEERGELNGGLRERVGREFHEIKEKRESATHSTIPSRRVGL